MNREISDLQTFIDGELRDKPIRLLEAGCGSASNLRFGDNVRLTGIDISKKQLERNAVLHEKILGDIQRYEFPPESFDAVVCWDVLEHLPEPEAALERFARAIRPDGIAILKLPNVFSVKGLIAKFTPHFFHILSARYFYGDKNAGKNDNPPFKTYLKFSISTSAIKERCGQNGLCSIYFATYDVGSHHWLQNKKMVHLIYITLKKIVDLLSLKIIGNSELIFIFKKRQPNNSSTRL